MGVVICIHFLKIYLHVYAPIIYRAKYHNAPSFFTWVSLFHSDSQQLPRVPTKQGYDGRCLPLGWLNRNNPNFKNRGLLPFVSLTHICLIWVK
jgi:hypothetical protein